MASGWDQFVQNVLRFEGQIHQVLRDLGFMVPDILHIWLSWLEMKEVGKKRGCPPSHLLKNNEVIVAFTSVMFLWLVVALVWPSDLSGF